MKQKHEAEGKELSTHSQKKTVLIRSILVTTVILALLVGLSYAWFFSRSNIATLVSISPPSPIAIKGAHGEALTALDLSYTDDDKKDGKVTIRRVISVSSAAEKHKLEIVHTTNLKGLTFNIYRAEESGEGQVSVGDGSVTESNYTYTYDSVSPISGKYINQNSESNGYKYANNSQHSKNYAEGDTVQIHAEPLYWVSDELKADAETKDPNDQDATLTYYVLEISWTETTKETDIFYVLAKEE